MKLLKKKSRIAGIQGSDRCTFTRSNMASAADYFQALRIPGIRIICDELVAYLNCESEPVSYFSGIGK
jgi:hypothetical protein